MLNPDEVADRLQFKLPSLLGFELRSRFSDLEKDDLNPTLRRCGYTATVLEAIAVICDPHDKRCVNWHNWDLNVCQQVAILAEIRRCCHKIDPSLELYSVNMDLRKRVSPFKSAERNVLMMYNGDPIHPDPNTYRQKVQQRHLLPNFMKNYVCLFNF